jgi:hemoglobin/transferrin/lactoferrin receptor protein
MKFSLILMYLLFVFQIIEGQVVRVSDHQSGHPIEGVVIRSYGKSVQTDSTGNASLNIFTDKETLEFQHPSYASITTDKQKITQKQFLVELIEKPLHLDEIVISTSRRKENRIEIPHQIILINPKKALDYQPETMADLLATGSEIFIQKSQQGGGSPMIRGFSANRLLIVVDGVRMNNALFRSGNLQNVVSLDPNMTESSEVIAGPGTVIHGSDAIGGVLSFQTLRPKLTTGKFAEENHYFRSGYSSANQHYTIHGRIGYGFRKWGLLISSTYSDFNDLVMGSSGPDEYLRREYVIPGRFTGRDVIKKNDNPRQQLFSGYHQLNLMSKLRYIPGSKTEFNLGIHYSATGDIPRYDRLIVTRNNQLRYGDWYYGPQKWLMVSGRFDWESDALIFDKMSLIAAYQHFTESRNERNIHSPWLYHRSEALDAGSITLDFSKEINITGSVSYGLEVITNVIGSAGTAENLLNQEIQPGSPRYPDGAHYNSYAGYITGRKRLNPGIVLNAGARMTLTEMWGEFQKDFLSFPFDHFQSKTSALTGNLGTVWNITPKWQASLLFSTGFRSPNIDDIAKVFDSEPGNVVVPNPALRPEFVFNRELRILHTLKNSGKIEISLFNSRLKNAMVRRSFALDGKDSIMYNDILSRVEAIVNADYGNVSGFSIAFDLPAGSCFWLKNSFSYLKGKDSEGYGIRHVPPVFGTSRIIFEKPTWTSEVFFRFNGKIPYSRMSPEERNKPFLYIADKNGNPYSPGWWTMNIMTGWSPSKNIRINLGIENIFNKRYLPYSSGLAASGRNLVLSLSISI